MAMASTPDYQSVKPSPVRWQFIDSSNDNAQNLTQVKRHVMQEYMRQKRLENHGQDTSDDGMDTTTVKDKKKKKKKRASSNESNKRQRAQRKQIARTSNPEIKTPEKTPIDKLKPTLRTEPSQPTPIPLSYHMNLHPINTSTAPTSSPWDFSSPSDSSDFFIETGPGYNSPTLSAWSRTELSPPPQTLLSAARTDPFHTLPLQLSVQDQQLFDFYVNDMPACSYGDHFRTQNAHNWYRDVFVHEAMKGPVTFVNTILVHAANTRAWLCNEIETEVTLKYRQRALQMLIDHTQKYPKDTSDNVITACMSAAAVEDFDPRPERKQISWIHMRQARNMIKERGGPAAFENTKLAMLINWQDYILAGYESELGGFHFEKDPSLPTAPLLPTLPSPPCSVSSVPIDSTSSLESPRLPNTVEAEVRLQCEDFLNFLSRCEHLAISQHTTLPASVAPNRHAAFQPGAVLGRILASPNGKRFTETGNRKQFISRLATVMMLNAALWDYRSSIRRAEAFLDHTVCKILDSEVNMSSSVEALLQILLACQDFPTDSPSDNFAFSPLALLHGDLDFPDYSQYSPFATSPSARPWFVGRMLKIAKRLSRDSWMRVNDFLYSCLTLQICEPSLLTWENDLRQEILQAPLTSYIMPALQ
ncbi:hypothetical protein BGW36DRAFT_385104 [Talaromyces proteolyticus]|uniref:Sigma-70 region 2 family protein n=1 Tax=Talaromyces proteolyticus TaxID=1131652 RepID=A0AAD4PT66_9EURO|nr:uncharacterized protein BGW36DRAFT_385104 [Talaromyces proteolyticus]KAH8692745.1 hypothetical protein BGW36DRAFT_385104 [Talaromyces proteolyticus]